jgi:16S rRNA (cytosine967-C5)-methyltransferase
LLKRWPLYEELLSFSLSARLLIFLYTILEFKKTISTLESLCVDEKYGPNKINKEEMKVLFQAFDRVSDLPPYLSKLYIQEWVLNKLQSIYGDDTEKLVRTFLEEAPIDLRVNTLKASRDDVLMSLMKEGLEVEATSLSPTGLRMKKRTSLKNHKLWLEGCIEFQDLGSQIVGLMCDVKPGMWVADVCAGAGGKTLSLAAQMHNKGKIFALDIYDWRLKDAKQRLKRASVHNVQTHNIQDAKWLKRHQESFDRVLVDAPCSGTGTWRRHADGKMLLTESILNNLQEVQQSILENASSLVKKGGQLIYSTCSLFAEENAQQAEWFLSQHTEFSIVPAAMVWEKANKDASYPGYHSNYLQLTPYHHQTDGFFIAIFEKN